MGGLVSVKMCLFIQWCGVDRVQCRCTVPCTLYNCTMYLHGLIDEGTRGTPTEDSEDSDAVGCNTDILPCS